LSRVHPVVALYGGSSEWDVRRGGGKFKNWRFNTDGKYHRSIEG
jgi:hypothetical protein